MSSRKLQTELDKLVKKVAEGIELFESFYDKVQTATNPTIKEKNEGELKKEIKKLQRHRDVIKSYIAGNEVKDKKVLIDNRKAIETCMEKFKAIEKELKRKAFSKEGLDAAAKVDPVELERSQLIEWLSNTVLELGTQIDALEAEQESLQTTMKKGKRDSSKAEQLAKVLHHLERHKFHVTKLEIILRMFENESLPIEQVRDLQDNVNYYVESNKDPDFAEDEFVYDDLDLEDAEVFGLMNNDDGDGDEHHHQVEDDGKHHDDSPTGGASSSKKKGSGGNNAKDADADKGGKGGKGGASAKTPAIALTPKSSASKLSAAKPFPAPNAPVPVVVAPIPAIKYAQAAAAHVGDKSSASTPSAQVGPSSQAAHAGDHESAKRDAAPVPLATGPPQIPFSQVAKVSSSSSASSDAKHPAPTTPSSKAAHPPAQSSPPAHVIAPPGPPPKLDPIETRIPSSLMDLVASFEVCKARAAKNDLADPQSVAMLEQSFKFVPECSDAERPRTYFPRNPYPTPSYYPQTPLALFDGSPANRTAYEKLDLDTLFFLFYYQQSTLPQLLAARELKRQSWRFHKKYLTWFQRHEEPKLITEEYEQGTYIYFDYEGAWCQRRKSDFRFEYRFLEDDGGVAAGGHGAGEGAP